jgi:hypothetical protein
MTKQQMDPVVPAWYHNPAADFGLAGRNAVRGGLALRVTAPEFTWLAGYDPVQHPPQPDVPRGRQFGMLVIEYEPDRRCMDQEAFGAYASAFAEQELGTEEVAVRIGNELVNRLAPKWITVEVQMAPRFGVTFWPRFEYIAERDGPVTPE